MMVLLDKISWYQKKIGTYDKQQWERTIEQRILHGLTHVPKKTAKLKTELIDVDLVRGSSFPKAKPKHGFATVTRLALVRLLLLPAYSRWWLQQTSARVFVVLFVLYVLQLYNVAFYFYCTSLGNQVMSESVSVSEVVVPAAMMLILSIIHSQIVSTQLGSVREPTRSKARRTKRTRRRPVITSRSRAMCSDSKSSPDTGSEKAAVAESGSNKYHKRVRLRRCSSEDVRRHGVVWDTCLKKRSSTQKRDGTHSGELKDRPRLRVQLALPEDAQRHCESVPLDDDGFESLNGNGSSENGDEVTEEVPALDCPQLDTLNTSPTQARACLNWSEGDQTATKNSERDRSALNWSNTGLEDHQCIDSVDEVVSLSKSCDDKITTFYMSDVNGIGSASDESAAIPATSNIENAVSHTTSRTSNHNPRDINLCKQSSLEEIDNLETNLNRAILEEAGMNCGEHRTTGSTINLGGTVSANAGIPLRAAWVQEVLTCRSTPDVIQKESDLEDEDLNTLSDAVQHDSLLVRRGAPQPLQLSCEPLAESSYNSSCESEEPETSPGAGPLLTEGTTSAGEWIGITTNSEECSYSSELEESDSQREYTVRDGGELNDHPFAWEFELSPTTILSPSCAASDRVSCTMWESRDVKKAELSVLDISSAIIARVESMPESVDYFYGGMVVALLIALLPSLCRMSAVTADSVSEAATILSSAAQDMSLSNISQLSVPAGMLLESAFGPTFSVRVVILIALVERCVLATLFFFLLAVAERTFKQRFLYAKLFSHLTSFRRARKSELPHFRLNKVRNIKTWLSVRSYLKKRGPQRSVDVIVSAAFLITLLLLSFLSVECLKVSGDDQDSIRLHSQYNLEALMWCLVLGVFLLRFMTLGTKINRKYRNVSVLITEQINLYLQIEQKPNKKEELMVANSVLKLAADLLKELESPFKISGLSANPYLYTITKVVILSALSGVLSEMLGFKLKLHKIKIK